MLVSGRVHSGMPPCALSPSVTHGSKTRCVQSHTATATAGAERSRRQLQTGAERESIDVNRRILNSYSPGSLTFSPLKNQIKVYHVYPLKQSQWKPPESRWLDSMIHTPFGANFGLFSGVFTRWLRIRGGYRSGPVLCFMFFPLHPRSLTVRP